MMWPWTKKKLMAEYDSLVKIGKGRRTKDQTIRIREVVRKLFPDTRWKRWWFRWKRRNDPLYIELQQIKKKYGL